jgi:hypothetical protein
MKRKKLPKYLREEQTKKSQKTKLSSSLSEQAIQYLTPQKLLSETLSSLLNERWNGYIPTSDDSYPIRHLYELQDTRISEYTIEDCRFLVSQNIGLEYIIPLAIEILVKNILAAGDFYEGDLLNAVLRVPDSFWKKNPLLYYAMKEQLELQKDYLENKIEIHTMKETISEFLNTDILLNPSNLR